jgi:hypothetical protein
MTADTSQLRRELPLAGRTVIVYEGRAPRDAALTVFWLGAAHCWHRTSRPPPLGACV